MQLISVIKTDNQCSQIPSKQLIGKVMRKQIRFRTPVTVNPPRYLRHSHPDADVQLSRVGSAGPSFPKSISRSFSKRYHSKELSKPDTQHANIQLGY